MDWYYAENNQQKGPVNDAALQELAAAGVVQDATLVWHSGLPNWQPYGAVRVGAEPSAPVAAAAFCSECGRQFATGELVLIGNRAVCAGCKQTVLQQIREGTATISGREYAGFWIRAAALIIDSLILGAINVALSIVLLGGAALAQDPSVAIGGFALYYLLSLAIGIGYEGWFLVNKGATPGKLALHLRVITDTGRPITWGLAIGRYFARVVSSLILCIGFLMVVWDEQRRALHDRICDTRVVKS